MKLKQFTLRLAIATALLYAPSVSWASGLFYVSTPAAHNPTFQSPTNSAQAPSQNSTSNKFVLVLKLDDNQINKLRIERVLSVPIPPDFVNRVGAVRFQRRVSFLSDPLKLVGDKTDKKNQSISIEVDNTILERLAYQPVEMTVYETGFDRIDLNFNPLGMAAGKLPTEFQPWSTRGAPIVYARINSRRGIYGTLADFETLAIETQFGKVKIPSREIAGIRFNDGDASRAFVVLKKGDVFAGKIDIKSISIQSRWGPQKLKIAKLESITTSQETVFLRDALNPSRWRLELIRPATLDPGSPAANWNLATPVPTNSVSQTPYLPNFVPPVAIDEQQLPFGFPN